MRRVGVASLVAYSVQPIMQLFEQSHLLGLVSLLSVNCQMLSANQRICWNIYIPIKVIVLIHIVEM